MAYIIILCITMFDILTLVVLGLDKERILKVYDESLSFSTVLSGSLRI